MKQTILFAASFFILVQGALAEDLQKIFDKVNALVNQKNYTKALDELSWARKEIEKMNMNTLATLLPETLGGLKGGKTETNSALGITAIEKEYSSGADMSVKVSITGGGPLGAGQGMGGGLAALGQMAAMMGQQAGQDVFRIDGMTASMTTDSGYPDLTVFLTSGSILKLEMTRGSDEKKLKEMAEAIGVSKIDNYLKGVS